MSLVPVLLVSACVTSVWAAIPPGYILRLTSNCGKENVKGAEISIVTDLDIAAIAACAKTRENFTSTDGVNYKLTVGYPGRGAHPCMFQKRKGARVYVLKVYVSYGPPGTAVHHSQEEYTVTCTFDAKNKQLTKQLNIGASRMAPKAVQSWKGKNTKATIRLLLVDVLGRDMHGQRLAVGRKVQLKASATGTAPNERGLRPVSCDAIGIKTGARLPLIRSGCGDGWFIKKNKGFTTKGLTCYSPYFNAFAFPHKEPIRFQCNFTMCARSCNGDSCAVRFPHGNNGRRRKSTRLTLSDKRFIPASSGLYSEVTIDNRKPDRLVWRRTSVQHAWVARVYIWTPVVIMMALSVLMSVVGVVCACARRNISRGYKLATKVKVLSRRPCGCSWNVDPEKPCRHCDAGCMCSCDSQNNLNSLAHLDTERPFTVMSCSGGRRHSTSSHSEV
ncbi:vitelline envelope sperm lysin receptor-like isoform X1 [Haliotis rubra]|uniref:vitelline envelope sperm lysin receptor-like isoform X1 n=1 Tax=Haliotis rubra TaxID=36100 RepID=UPI001EE61293|nr:vitelline envelope sperm lysin receptor-like isoform X1 [Haliotis rubra]